MAVIRIPLLALTCLLLLGCSSSRTSSLQPAFQDYEAGHLSIARLEAKRVFERDDADKYEAAWVIGLCNQRLGSDSAALAAFETASKSPDPALSARARAMVGQCLVESGQPAVAAVHFEHAWPELKGEDRRQCARYAAQAWREAGREDRAELWASRLDDSGEAQHYIPAPVPIEGVARERFTLQAGAFRDEGGARRACNELAMPAERAGVTTPIVRSRTDRHGSTLYLVHVGSFMSRNDAARARRDFKNMDMIVVAN